MIVDKLMKRTEFKPDPRGSNALFTFFAQHFTHQFFKTDFQRGPAFQWGGHGVSVFILCLSELFELSLVYFWLVCFKEKFEMLCSLDCRCFAKTLMTSPLLMKY